MLAFVILAHVSDGRSTSVLAIKTLIGDNYGDLYEAAKSEALEEQEKANKTLQPGQSVDISFHFCDTVNKV